MTVSNISDYLFSFVNVFLWNVIFFFPSVFCVGGLGGIGMGLGPGGQPINANRLSSGGGGGMGSMGPGGEPPQLKTTMSSVVFVQKMLTCAATVHHIH